MFDYYTHLFYLPCPTCVQSTNMYLRYYFLRLIWTIERVFSLISQGTWGRTCNNPNEVVEYEGRHQVKTRKYLLTLHAYPLFGYCAYNLNMTTFIMVILNIYCSTFYFSPNNLYFIRPDTYLFSQTDSFLHNDNVICHAQFRYYSTTHIARYDRVRNRKNNFEIPTFLNFEWESSRAGNSYAALWIELVYR